ncbi:GNAT family N-acetyltransferase [Sphingomonas sp. AP4-R1]|uniref:GNAT family N-acetyltransferase n=1 Tax=Sphingomonas sp. AP4-R1 TaxID=2735134 RepID=UPI0014938488|nr:GNAT family N-acetyltransferase [Sphingomonas sp. AP4-R1]QJU59578.1 GNAT family N-acetyltransferase [Sphingomonas sp. AP4-R1]
MNAIPPQPVRIETERLILRLHRPDDLAGRLAMTNDDAVVRFIGGETQDEEENWTRILRYNGHWALFGWGVFAIEEKASGAFIGEAGFADFHRGLGDDFDPYPEGAWVFSGAAQGKGYATEVMEAAIAWRERRFGPSRMVCLIAHENQASLRVAAKLGFAPFAERRYHDVQRILLARPEGDGGTR